MSEPVSSRRKFLSMVGRGAGLVAVGAAALRLTARADADKVWQINPDACNGCKDLNEKFENLARCATDCAVKVSAVRVVNDFEKCGYCNMCPAYYDVQSPLIEKLGIHEGLVCPYDALKRREVGDSDPSDPKNNAYEYTVDESKCTGCGKCVMNCKPPMGNGSLRMEVRHNLCVDCNQCAIATACPADAFVRVPVKSKRPGR